MTARLLRCQLCHRRRARLLIWLFPRDQRMASVRQACWPCFEFYATARSFSMDAMVEHLTAREKAESRRRISRIERALYGDISVKGRIGQHDTKRFISGFGR